MSIADEKYVSLVTYTKDGTPKPSPVWIVDLGDGTIGFTTWGESWKAKRVRNNPNITLQPCDARGTVVAGSQVVEGSAVMGGATDYARVAPLIKAKYGFGVTLVKVMNKFRTALGKGGQSDSAMIITLS